MEESLGNMEQRGHGKRGKYQNNILLLTVLIGFCILALIEIAYGHAQMKVEKERLALEESNNQAMQELREEWNRLKDGAVVVTDEETSEQAVSGGEKAVAEQSKVVEKTEGEETETADGNLSDENKDYDMQIVILGDSIMDNDRSESGVAAIIGEQCNAKVYNMAMGGTTAALMPTEQYNYATWDSRCLLGVVNAILGNINTDIFDDYAAGRF